MDDPIEIRKNWLIKRACYYQNVQPSALYTKSQKRYNVYARNIVWYNLKRSTHLSLVNLGAIFNRDHATVLNSLKTYNNLRDTDRTWRENVNKIQKDYESKFPTLENGDEINDIEQFDYTI